MSLASIPGAAGASPHALLARLRRLPVPVFDRATVRAAASYGGFVLSFAFVAAFAIGLV